MRAWLLDINVLIALVDTTSGHHDLAHDWFAANVQRFATCPITQGGLLRNYGRAASSLVMPLAWQLLDGLIAHPLHEFWPDDLGYSAVSHVGLRGRAQITDAYLAALARHHGGRVATFDVGFEQQHPDVVTRIRPS